MADGARTQRMAEQVSAVMAIGFVFFMVVFVFCLEII